MAPHARHSVSANVPRHSEAQARLKSNFGCPPDRRTTGAIRSAPGPGTPAYSKNRAVVPSQNVAEYPAALLS